MARSAPCKNCPSRTPSCHSDCADYKEYSEERELIRLTHKANRITDDYSIDSVRKKKRRRN